MVMCDVIEFCCVGTSILRRPEARRPSFCNRGLRLSSQPTEHPVNFHALQDLLWHIAAFPARLTVPLQRPGRRCPSIRPCDR